MLLNPGVTSADGNNPGFSLFKLDTHRQLAYGLTQTFLQIEKTYNWTHIPSQSHWPFIVVDYAADFGLDDLSVDSIDSLKQRMQQNATLTFDYLAKKIGYHAHDADGFEKSMGLYRDDDNVLTDANETYRYFCLMSDSLLLDQLDMCIEKERSHSHSKKKVIRTDFEKNAFLSE